MEKYQEKWQSCLRLIAEKVSQHSFDVWFKDVTMESYDPDRKTVILCVPHRYVYEYLEEVQAQLLKQSLDTAFGTDVRLNYRLRQQPVATPSVDFPDTCQIPRFSIPNARERLEKGLQHYLGGNARWLPAYDKVVEWLSDNKGRGLLCFGPTGLGKTLICEKILPVILGRSIPFVSSVELHDRLDALLKERCVIIDDLGKEPMKYYGQTDRSFFRLCDAAEKNGILLIITTNLSTTAVADKRFSSSIEERYGAETISRLRAVTRAIFFDGEDLRR
jgi:DNA replication protein DnaC